MWGQPPSAVRASGARLALQCHLPNLKFNDNLPSCEALFLKLPTTLQASGASLRRTAGGGCPHIETMPKAFYRRPLPLLQCDDKQHLVTFCTAHRLILPERVRSTVLECCLHDTGKKFDLRICVV